MSEKTEPRPGWYARLEGHEFDLEDWADALHEPFDPVALKLPSGETVLRSSEFEELMDPNEVRERALVLIGRMNGALGLDAGVRPVRFAGVTRLRDDGGQDAFIYGSISGMELRARCRGVAVVRGPDGEEMPQPPPEPSKPQLWAALAGEDPDVAEMLDHFGQANSWYEIYKTIEIAADLVGGKHKLWRLMEPERANCKRLDETANFHRHARGGRGSPHFDSPAVGRPYLAMIVRKALEAVSTSA